MKIKILILALVLTLLSLGISLAIIRHKNQPAYGQTITFQGEYVCLDHKDQNGPQTAECGGGFSNGSKVYEIDNDDYYNAHPDLNIGADEYVITGVLQPPGEFYKSDGIIVITDLKLAK